MFVITPEILEEIKKVKDYAEANPYTADELQKLISHEIPPAGDDARFVCLVPVSNKVVYSIEEQPCGYCRHMSMSSSKNLPHPHAVSMIAKAFGFVGKLEDWTIWFEDIPGSDQKAVNIAQLMGTHNESRN